MNSEINRFELTDIELSRFNDKFIKAPAPQCWLWTGSHIREGYGNIRVRGVMYGAHRLSYMIHKGSIPRGLQVCHRCDIRDCVNPDHLFLGTAKENIHDMIAKGRAVYGSPRKYSDEQVQEMRNLYHAGMSMAEIGRRYGASYNYAAELCRGLVRKTPRT